MATYIAFLRAVNVGGRKVAMADLRAILSANGCSDVETHIASGNVRLGLRARSGAAVEAKLEKLLADNFGFEVATLVRTPAELAALVETAPADPLGGAEARHYVSFLREVPTHSAAEAIDGWEEAGVATLVVGREVHMWMTKSTHATKLSNGRVEKLAAMAATNRNWTVVSALAKKWG